MTNGLKVEKVHVGHEKTKRLRVILTVEREVKIRGSGSGGSRTSVHDNIRCHEHERKFKCSHPLLTCFNLVILHAHVSAALFASTTTFIMGRIPSVGSEAIMITVVTFGVFESQIDQIPTGTEEKA